MRILFDHGVPAPLRRAFSIHEVSTACEMGWARLDNGDLLAAAEKAFDVFITTDQNLSYQQNRQPAHRDTSSAHDQLAEDSKAHQ